MTMMPSSLHFFRHRDLAEWFDLVRGPATGELAGARRAAMIRSLDEADIAACDDPDLLDAVAALLRRGHIGGEAADLSRLIGTPRRSSLAAAAEARSERLLLDSPEFCAALDADISLLRECFAAVNLAG